MTKNNVRIAIRDSTDSYNIDFFDNVSGINYHTADLQRFLAGSSSILTLKYRTKDIDKVTVGCKLAFRYKGKGFWLSIMEVKKNGFDKELTAFSLILEANNEDKGPFSADKGMTMAEYIKKFDVESSLTIGINEVADKSIKLEWTGTDTMLARLFSVANSFGAELEFVTELNNDYSLKRHVLNIYRAGNFGKNATGLPVRVGKELKVINYSENIKNLRTVVFATGKNGLTIEGLSKKIYDDNGELLYETSGAFIRAVQSRDRFPSVGKNTTDNYALLNLGDTEYETKEALYGYMLSELKKRCLPEMDFEVEGVIDGDVGDTKTLIDDVFHEPELYVQARISELTESIITGENTNVVLSNYERKYSQIADSLLKQVEALAEDAAPYIVRLSTDNGYNFKNGQGSSTITAKLEKYSKIVNASWKWLINNSVVSENTSVTINANQVIGTLNVVAVAIVDGNEVAREYITFTNSDDGVGIKSIKRYYTTNDQAEGVTAGGQNWSTKPTTVTADNNYLWSYDVITYTNDTSLVTEPAVIGARGDDGLDADTTGITEALDKAKQELTALSANIEKVRDDSLAAVNEAKQQLTAVANDLSTAKQDLQTQASQLTAQANAQSELTKRVSSVEETANGTKTTVNELSKTVDSNTKNITSVTARTKTVEDDLLNTKTTLSQVKTTADSTSQKTATLETGLNGLNAKFETLKIGSRNYFKNSKSRKYYINSTETQDVRTYIDDEFWQNDTRFTKNYVRMSFDIAFDPALPSNFTTNVHFSASPWYNCGGITFKGGTTALQHFDLKFDLSGASKSYKTDNVFIRLNNTLPLNTAVSLENFNLYLSAVVEDYNQNEADIESKVAEYRQTAEQNYASLQSNLQTLDGTVKQNKSEFDQTASQIKSSISAVEGKASELDGDITKLNTTLTQTANGLEQLSTQVTSQGNTITSHTNSINSLSTGLSAKVSQTDFNTLSGRVTTAENNITAKANELSSKISSLNVGNKNYLPTSRVINRGCTNFSYSETSKSWTMTVPASSTTFGNGITFNTSGLNILLNGGETLFFGLMIKANKACSFNYDINNYLSGTTSNDNDDRSKQAWSPTSKSIPANVWTRVWFSYTAKANVPITENNSNFGIVNNTEAINIEIKEVMVAKSNVPVDYQTPDADFEAKNTELKQTTDSIKASVSALDNATVKTASLNLDNNGFVTKVGKTVNGNTFATMIAQDENDVQIIAKKMKVSGDMIVNGAITGDKIQANSIDVSKISGLDATYLKAKIETAMVDWLKGKTIVADNGATKIDLLSGYINFDSDTPAIRRVTSGIPTQFLKFLKSDNNSVTTIGSNRDGSESSTNDSFAGIKITSGDSFEQTEIISDQIYFFTGATNRQGWQMSTVSGEDNRQITLFPSGNPTKSNIYASDYFIKGSDGWVKLIDFINYFNACLKHLQNYTGRTDIWNAFKI
ncbi:gp58-like family protein [Streptococcus gallolyticus]|uniref:gp58-like family protein n=1 Tax=Streptococcus gallolyticus TaxID=315405 RepID=UPI002283421A|nr:gp58-like family protein [Streptococcus gallolyticus]MCY7185728.1 gp58-like family protein [Streptococcus gallolyticus subsp. gallolyticus]MCY7188942.1 gp58-like family protein [Streptococcus gallolyticus subsp. gallolyticus]